MDRPASACPMCGCSVDHDPDALLVECGCCGTVWLLAEHDRLERILVGAEG